MKIAQLFGKGKTVFSCEVFPPKKTSPVDSIYKTLDGLKDIHPDFISVTFGAGGSTKMVEPGTNHIERVFNLKYPKEYTERPEKAAANQAAFAAFYESLKGAQ